MNRSEKHLPKFEYVRRELEERIRKGLFAHNAPLPPEDELAALFGVGRNTVRRAIDLLEKEQFVIKQQGKVSHVNCPGNIVRKTRVGKLAYFSNVKPNLLNCNMIYLDIFYQILSVAAAYDLAVDFFSTDSMNCWNNFMSSRAEYLGVFSVGVRGNNVNRGVFERLNSLPELIALDEGEELPGKHLISIDNYAGGALAARHLVQCRCCKVAVLMPPELNKPFRLRQEGFLAEIKKHPQVQCHVVTINPEVMYRLPEPGELDELYRAIADADGVFCYCDMLAMQILDAASYYNLKVPEKLSVVGFDGLVIGQHTQPKLTTIEQPNRELAEAAVKLAFEISANKDMPPQNILLSGRLLPGETTRI